MGWAPTLGRCLSRSDERDAIAPGSIASIISISEDADYEAMYELLVIFPLISGRTRARRRAAAALISSNNLHVP
jgi:hypothetical protein